MQDNNQCPQCKQNFNIQQIPLILECEHICCQLCIQSEQNKTSYYECLFCHSLTRTNYQQLSTDLKIVQQIQKQTNQPQIEKYKSQNMQIYQQQLSNQIKQLQDKMSQVQQEVNKVLEQNVFRDTNKIIDKLNSYLSSIQQQQNFQSQINQSGYQNNKQRLNYKQIKNLENQASLEIIKLEENSNLFLQMLKQTFEIPIY